MIRLRSRNVRTRLTLWYTSILAGLLILYALGTTIFLFFNLRHELDRGLRRDFELVEERLRLTPENTIDPAGLKAHHEDAEVERWLEVWTISGELLYGSGNRTAGLPEKTTPVEQRKSGYTSDRLVDGTRVRVLTELHAIEGREVLVRLAHSEERLWHEMGEFIGVLLLGLPVALLLAAIGGYSLARRALQPIDRMAHQAEAITAERLKERLPIENPHDELGHLGQVFNSMLERIQSSFEQLKRFTADASHELRTPLTVLRSVGEVGLHNHKDAGHYREVISSMLEEVDRMTRLVESLLTLSRADAGHIQLKQEEIALFDLVQEALNLLTVLAEEKKQTISLDGDRRLRVVADRMVLRQALINLIDNAIKYSPAKGEIAVRVHSREEKWAVVEVEDSGPGIPPEHHERLFERFYRVDKARSREMGGAGLGLSIVRWAAAAHGGRVELKSKERHGCIFQLILPQ